jgi:hypothetical protein
MHRMLYDSRMTTNEEREALRARLRKWGRQQRDRDSLVLAALTADISIEEIHQLMGIARTTIDRIREKDFTERTKGQK